MNTKKIIYTDRSNIPFNIYLKEISKIKLLSIEEEAELAKKIKLGDENALERLIISNLRYVVSAAKKFEYSGLSLNDLISEGNIGLINAARRFDATRGFRFITYAEWYIRQAILQAIEKKSHLVQPSHETLLNNKKVKKETERLEQILERTPSVREVCQSLNMTENEIKNFFNLPKLIVSTDTPLGDKDSYTDILPDSDAPSTDNDLMRKSLSQELRYAISNLPENEKRVITMFFGIDIPYPYTIDDIAATLGLTSQRIRQIKENGIQHLKDMLQSEALQAYA